MVVVTTIPQSPMESSHDSAFVAGTSSRVLVLYDDYNCLFRISTCPDSRWEVCHWHCHSLCKETTRFAIFSVPTTTEYRVKLKRYTYFYLEQQNTEVRVPHTKYCHYVSLVLGQDYGSGKNVGRTSTIIIKSSFLTLCVSLKIGIKLMKQCTCIIYVQ